MRRPLKAVLGVAVWGTTGETAFFDIDRPVSNSTASTDTVVIQKLTDTEEEATTRLDNRAIVRSPRRPRKNRGRKKK